MTDFEGCFTALIVAVFAAIFIGCGFITMAEYENEHWETITVVDKTVGISSQQSSYLIYTEKEVYKIQDLFFCGFFRTSDVYNQLHVGSTYRVKVRGRRWPFMSMYKNIVGVQKIE